MKKSASEFFTTKNNKKTIKNIFPCAKLFEGEKVIQKLPIASNMIFIIRFYNSHSL